MCTCGRGAVPVMVAYCLTTSRGLGPMKMNKSNTPLSLMKCESTRLSDRDPDTRLTREDMTFVSLLLLMSTQVSAALFQNTPTVFLGLQKKSITDVFQLLCCSLCIMILMKVLQSDKI